MNRVSRGIIIGVGLPVAALGCALNRQPTLAPARLAELWEEPRNLEQRDLFNGPDGAEQAPRTGGRFTFVAMKTSGFNPGYDVKDAQGRKWAVKLGVESRVEVAVSRLVWAIGYHQPNNFFVRDWTLTGDGEDRVEGPARFRLEAKGTKKEGEWAWRDNPFLGTRQLAGLFVLMVMVNNWDLKPAQNPIYRTEDGDNPGTYYVVRDLGASLGKTAWIRNATKDDVNAFEREGFIERIEGNRVRFYFQGAWREPQLINSVTRDDVRWVCELLARLSPAQLRDAFRAGGFTDAESERYVHRLREKIAEGLRVGSK